jgi:hypothetical protein
MPERHQCEPYHAGRKIAYHAKQVFLAVPQIHVDDLYYEPGITQRFRDITQSRQRMACQPVASFMDPGRHK